MKSMSPTILPRSSSLETNPKISSVYRRTRFSGRQQKMLMDAIKELLKEPDFIRSQRLSALTLKSIGSDSRADRERLDQLLKALRFIAATTSPATAPLLKLVFESIELLCRDGISKDQRPAQRHRKRQYITAKRHISCTTLH